MLEPFLLSEIFGFLLIFVRVGGAVMLFPGVGEGYVSPRIRLAFALMVALAMMPALAEHLPSVPDSPLALAALIAKELVIGIFLGMIARIAVSAMHTVGLIFSYQSSLSAATIFDMTQASQGSSIGNFLSLTAIVLLFATNMHHLMLEGLFESYTLFIPADTLPTGDMANYMTRLAGDVFMVAMKLASPMLLIGIMLNLASGILSRLMPNMQVFFIIIPPQILLSLIMLTLTLSGMLLWYLGFVEEHLAGYIQ